MGFYLLKADNVIYKNPIIKVIISTYIDDFLIISKKSVVIKVKVDFNKVFYIKNLGPVRYFISVRIIRDRINKKIFFV